MTTKVPPWKRAAKATKESKAGKALGLKIMAAMKAAKGKVNPLNLLQELQTNRWAVVKGLLARVVKKGRRITTSKIDLAAAEATAVFSEEDGTVTLTLKGGKPAAMTIAKAMQQGKGNTITTALMMANEQSR